jgi:predicted Na+-dependent transporter
MLQLILTLNLNLALTLTLALTFLPRRRIKVDKKAPTTTAKEIPFRKAVLGVAMAGVGDTIDVIAIKMFVSNSVGFSKFD